MPVGFGKAVHQEKAVDFPRRTDVIAVAFQILLHDFFRDALTPPDGEVGMVCPEIRRDSNLEKGVLDLFVQLKEMGVGFGEPGPNDVGGSFCGKHAHPTECHHKLPDFDSREFLANRFAGFFWNLTDEFQGNMKVVDGFPPDHVKLAILNRLEGGEILRDIAGRKQCDEQATHEGAPGMAIGIS